MTEWKEHKFSDFALINPTISLKSNEVYSFVEMKDLQDGRKYCQPSIERKVVSGSRFQNRDTLFAKITPCLENGKICQVRNLKNGIGFGSTEFFVFRQKDNISDSDFIFYLSRWEDVRAFAENNFVGTSGRQRVPRNCFDNLNLKLPSLPEQKAIASVLSSLDDKIDLLNRQNKTLEQMAETLFRQWFIEEADESWEEKKLGEISFFYNGKVRPNDKGNIPIYGGNGILGYTNNWNYSGKSIIIGRVGAYCGSIYFENSNIWVSDNALLVKPVEDNQVYYLFYLLKSMDLNSLAEGSSHPLLTQTILKSIEIQYPPIETIYKFKEQLENYHLKTLKNQSQIHTLTQLRDNLLPKLMSGEIRVEG
jgi:type I restriction enzyme S subunit